MEIYTEIEVAKKMRVTPKTVIQWINRGWLEAFRAPKCTRITESALNEFLKKQFNTFINLYVKCITKEHKIQAKNIKVSFFLFSCC